MNTWLEDHPTRDVAAVEIPSDDDVRAWAQTHGDALAPRRQIAEAHQRDMRDRADGVPARQRSVEGYEKRSSELFALAEREDAAGHPDAAIAAVQEARTARDMYQVKQPALDALIAQVDAWDFDAHEQEISALVREQNEWYALVADEGLRSDVRIAVIEAVQAARELSRQTLVYQLQQQAIALDPAHIAAQIHAEGQAKIAAKEAFTAGSRSVPQKPRTNADPRVAALAAQALAGISNGGRVDPMPNIHMSTGGPTVPARVGRS